MDSHAMIDPFNNPIDIMFPLSITASLFFTRFVFMSGFCCF